MIGTSEWTGALQLLGLARRAGAVIGGVERCRAAIRAGRAGLVVVAADASPGQRRKIEGLSRARAIPVVVLESRAALGSAIGTSPSSALVVVDPRWGRRIENELLGAGRGEPGSGTAKRGASE